MKELTIYKSKWVRGNGHVGGEFFGNPELLNRHNKMCCLGFLGKACGVTDDVMLYTVTPLDVPGDKYPDLTREEWNKFISVNDNSLITDKQRQDRLRRMFNKIGYKVSFKP